jgi:hypothetical protein
MKINEVCKPTKLDNGAEACIVQMTDTRTPGEIAKHDEEYKQDEIEYEKFERMGQHAQRQANARKPKTLMQSVAETSVDLPSSDFRHTQNFSVNSGKELDFAQYLAQQMEILGVTKDQATRLFKASKDGDYSWVERFGQSPKLKRLIGHNIGTAMTSNAVAIHNAMGLHAGLLKVQPKQTRMQTPTHVPDDLQPGGHDTDEYQQSKDNKQARQYRDRDLNWSGLR